MSDKQKYKESESDTETEREGEWGGKRWRQSRLTSLTSDLKLTIMSSSSASASASSSSMPTGESTGWVYLPISLPLQSRFPLIPSLSLVHHHCQLHASEKFNYCAWMNHWGEAATGWGTPRLTRSLLRCLVNRGVRAERGLPHANV